MSDEQPQDAAPPAPELAMEDARVYLLNGLAFGIRVPAEDVAYGNWLKIIKADGIIVGGVGEVIICYDAIACIVKGETMHKMGGGMFPDPAALPATGWRH